MKAGSRRVAEDIPLENLLVDIPQSRGGSSMLPEDQYLETNDRLLLQE